MLIACHHGRAKKLHEDRHSEMQQTLTQMNDRTEALDRLTAQKEAANAAKADAEEKLQKLAETSAKYQAAADRTSQLVEAYREAGLKVSGVWVF